MNDLTYRIATPERRKQTRQFHISVMTVTFCDEEDENMDDTYLELQPYDVSGDEDVRCNEELTPDKLAALNQIKESFKDVFRNCPGNTLLWKPTSSLFWVSDSVGLQPPTASELRQHRTSTSDSIGASDSVGLHLRQRRTSISDSVGL